MIKRYHRGCTGELSNDNMCSKCGRVITGSLSITEVDDGVPSGEFELSDLSHILFNSVTEAITILEEPGEHILFSSRVLCANGVASYIRKFVEGWREGNRKL